MAKGHATVIGRISEAMGLSGRLAGHKLTSEGISGSRIYRVWFDGRDAVLKVTDPEAAPLVRERARRELSFYRALSNQIPVRVPELLGSCDHDVIGTCLLLGRYNPPPPSTQWPVDDAVEVARQLARLHAAFWDKREQLHKYAWLRQLRARADEKAIEQAQDAWRALGRADRFSALFSPDVYRMLDSGLACVPRLDATIQAFPATLCHGDCHLGNLLRDEEGRLLWADWAEVGIGAGPTDLSFLIQRANADGARFSVDELAAAYHSQLVEGIAQPVSLDGIRRVMDAFELRTRLLDWPHYLSWASAQTVSDMLARIGILAERC